MDSNELIDFILTFRQNTDDNVDTLQLAKDQLTMKNLKNIGKLDDRVIRELQYIITLMFEEGDTSELFNMAIYLCKDVSPQISIIGLNNLAVYLFNANMIEMAKKIAKFNLKHYCSGSPQVQLISCMNVARIYYLLQNYTKALTITEKGLLQYEPFIFREMKNNQVKLQRNPGDVVLLLNGYMFYGKCVYHLQEVNDKMDIDYNKFFTNGAKIGRKYLGSQHNLTRQFQMNERNSVMVKRGMSHYVTQKKYVIRNANCKRISIQCHLLLQQLRQNQPMQKIERQSSQNRYLVKSVTPGAQGLGNNSSDTSKSMSQTFRIQAPQRIDNKLQYNSDDKSNILSSPRLRIQSPKIIKTINPNNSSIDIEAMIQKKFDNFVSQQNNNKKPEPKITELERKVNDLTKENLKIQQQRTERELEIEQLKQCISQLTVESSQIKVRLSEQEVMSENMKNMHVESPKAQQQVQVDIKPIQSTLIRPIKSSTKIVVGRQSTTDIHNLISTLQQGDQDEIINNKQQDINSISMINDTDVTVDQNLTLLDQNDSTKHYNVVLTQDMTISKRIPIDGCLYDVQCMMVQRNKELCLKITVGTPNSLESPKSKDIERIEYVEMSILKDLIQLVEYRRVLPYNSPLKCITSFKSLVQYLIFPFVTLRYDDSDYRVSIVATAPGILYDPDKLWIFEEQCSISLHHIDNGVIRLMMIHKSSQQASIDLQLDQSSIELFFDVINVDEYEKEEVQQILRILEYIYIYSRNTIDKSNDTVKLKHKMHSVSSYILKDQARFMQFLEKVIKDVSEVFSRVFHVHNMLDLIRILNGNQITMPNKSQAKLQLCAIRVWDKAVNQRLALAGDNSREQCIEIYLHNLYETYAPKGQKVMAEGYIQCTYDQVTQKLGLNCYTLSSSDWVLVANILSSAFTLHGFTKELDQDDYDRYKLNSIMEVEIQCESYSRQYLNQQGYKIPLTISYLGLHDQPIGVRVSVYDEITLRESGLFLTISPVHWEVIKKPIELMASSIVKKKQRSKKYISYNKMTAEYYLTKILNKVGWQIIMDKISLQVNNNRLVACCQLTNGQCSYIDKLENMINSTNVLDNRNKKIQS